MSDFYTTRTANLRATRGDFSKINAKQIILNGKNILDYLGDSEFNSYDSRDPQLKNDELDIWNTEISLSEEGHIEVKPHVHSVKNGEETNWETVYEGITESQVNTLKTAVKVIDNEVLGANDEHIMYWQTDGLTDDSYMFQNCTNLTSFSSDLTSLTNSSGMFHRCSNLTSFSSDLSSLAIGYSMFDSCKLDAHSIGNIIHSIKNHSDDVVPYIIDIGIGCNNTAEDQLLFAQECDCETWQELLDDFSSKNWTVTFQCNGRPTTTYNMRRGETLPVYTKLEEVAEGEHYAYSSADGSKFYNINYFHSTNGSTEGYDVFSSLEEAISTYNVTPKN